MKIGKFEFPDIEEGGLIYDPDPAYSEWVKLNEGHRPTKRFHVLLWDRKTRKVKVTWVTVRDHSPEEYNEEKQKELLRVAFVLEKKEVKEDAV
jgi:hypothetical protein